METKHAPDKLDEHIERERERFGLTPREIGFIERSWRVSNSNSHAALTTALDQCVEALEWALREVEGFEKRTGHHQMMGWIDNCRTTLEQAKKASGLFLTSVPSGLSGYLVTTKNEQQSSRQCVEALENCLKTYSPTYLSRGRGRHSVERLPDPLWVTEARAALEQAKKARE